MNTLLFVLIFGTFAVYFFTVYYLAQVVGLKEHPVLFTTIILVIGVLIGGLVGWFIYLARI